MSGSVGGLGVKFPGSTRPGIRRVWLYRAAGKGALSAEAVDFCRGNGIQVVEGYCPYVFLPGAAFPQRAHAFLMKLAHGYPSRAA
jgi:hypothetical protein